MTDAPPARAGIYPYLGLRRNNFLVVSVDPLNRAGTVVVVEIAEDAPDDVRGLLAVQLDTDDPLPGQWALCWRINYASAERFDVSSRHGVVTERTMAAVVRSIRNAIEPP